MTEQCAKANKLLGFMRRALPSPFTASFQALSRSMHFFGDVSETNGGGRRLDNLGVLMREHF